MELATLAAQSVLGFLFFDIVVVAQFSFLVNAKSVLVVLRVLPDSLNDVLSENKSYFSGMGKFSIEILLIAVAGVLKVIFDGLSCSLQC